MITHKQWLDNEYKLWVDALEHCTVNNFKENAMVRRMLSLDLEFPFSVLNGLSAEEVRDIITIDNIGYVNPSRAISGACARMVYYAWKVLEHKPSSIVEIGGGVGQFFAVMRVLGYKGDYWIADLSEVQVFQAKYLQEVANLTGLHTEQRLPKLFDMCVSFYALGEFDDRLKQWYINNIVSKCPRGFIIWNPHSGASAEIPFKCTVVDEYPLLNSGNKQLEW